MKELDCISLLHLVEIVQPRKEIAKAWVKKTTTKKTSSFRLSFQGLSNLRRNTVYTLANISPNAGALGTSTYEKAKGDHMVFKHTSLGVMYLEPNINPGTRGRGKGLFECPIISSNL